MDEEEILTATLALPPDRRARLAREIIASLDAPADMDAEAAWTVEVERRFKEAQDGTVELRDWADVRKRIESMLGR